MKFEDMSFEDKLDFIEKEMNKPIGYTLEIICEHKIDIFKKYLPWLMNQSRRMHRQIMDEFSYYNEIDKPSGLAARNNKDDN